MLLLKYLVILPGMSSFRHFLLQGGNTMSLSLSCDPLLSPHHTGLRWRLQVVASTHITQVSSAVVPIKKPSLRNVMQPSLECMQAEVVAKSLQKFRNAEMQQRMELTEKRQFYIMHVDICSIKSNSCRFYGPSFRAPYLIYLKAFFCIQFSYHFFIHRLPTLSYSTQMVWPWGWHAECDSTTAQQICTHVLGPSQTKQHGLEYGKNST